MASKLDEKADRALKIYEEAIRQRDTELGNLRLQLFESQSENGKFQKNEDWTIFSFQSFLPLLRSPGERAPGSSVEAEQHFTRGACERIGGPGK